MNKPYIDVREIHPVYIDGISAYPLEGCNRNITVQDANVELIRRGIFPKTMLDEIMDSKLSAYESDLVMNAGQFVYSDGLSSD